LNYIEPLIPEETQGPHIHKYTIHITNAVWSKEAADLYLKYEMVVHRKNRDSDMFLRNYCNSPIYDPEHEKEFEEKPCLNFFTNIDKEKGLDQAD
jgi:arginyl-tRNA--protein-N-Asp/Glu arginylyltransferase